MAKHYLHVGVFRAGRLVDDRYRALKGTLTVGRSAGNNIWLAGAKGLPDDHTLFTFERRTPTLHVLPGMTGEIAIDGKTKQPLEALRGKGQAAGTGWSLELPEAARGWVQLGDTTFFLQQSTKPPPPPKTTLPASAKTGVFSGLERTFATAFGVVFLIEAGGLGFISTRPHLEPEAPLEQEDLDRFAEIIMPEKKPEAAKAEEKPAEEAKEEKKEDKKEDKKPAQDEAAKAAAHAEAVKKAVANSKLLQVLGSAGGDGALANVFASSKGFGADISDALNGAGGVKVATGDEGPEHKGGSGGDGAVGIGDLGSAAGGGSGKAHLGERKTVQPQISLDDNDVDVESGSVDKDALNKFVRNRLRSIQSCYEKELKLNPGLKGKIVVRFTVTAAGKVGEASIDSDSMHADAVSSCIIRTIKAWAFPFKPDEDVPVSFPFVFQPGG